MEVISKPTFGRVPGLLAAHTAVIRWLGSIDAAATLFRRDTTRGGKAIGDLTGSLSNVGTEEATGIVFNIGACNLGTGDTGIESQNVVARTIGVMGSLE